MNAPYTDNCLIYDRLRHRYVLSPAHVLSGMNINLDAVIDASGAPADTANEAAQILDRVSRAVYERIYSCTVTPRKIERILALDDDCRNTLLMAQEYQLRYLLSVGDISVTVSGIEGGIDRRAIKAAAFSPDAEAVLLNAGLLCSGFGYFERDIVPDYEGEGY